MTESDFSKLDNNLTRNAVEIRQIIQDFSLCSTFREIDDQNALVREEMEVMRTNIGKLEVMAMEMLDLDQSRLIMTQVHSHREQLAACQRQFRLANVKAMAALEAQSSRDLFKSSTDASKSGLRNRKDKEQMVAEHGSITNNLKAISRQLAETVEKSKQTVSNLEETSRTVEEVGEEHRLMGGVIGQSRKLITKYGRREFTDKVLIVFALAFFFAVVLYILRKRLFPTYGPLEVIFYLLGFTGNIFSSVSNLWN